MSNGPSRLQQEIKQNKPFRSAAQEAMLALLRTADVVRRHSAELVDPEGITTQQYNVLRILRGAGADGLPTLEIAARMIEQAPGITRLLDRLEVKKLVHRERCPEDRRQVTCRITPGGLTLLARLDKVVDATDDLFQGKLSLSEQRQLIRLLDRVRGHLEGE
jgi:MarR family transcriptional regulator, organic hydroperoxide resistance regulator